MNAGDRDLGDELQAEPLLSRPLANARQGREQVLAGRFEGVEPGGDAGVRSAADAVTMEAIQRIVLGGSLARRRAGTDET